jgi:hypothetical protein
VLTLGFLLIGTGFPLAALMARRRSAKALWTLTGLVVVVGIVLALVLATSWAGNRLVESQGYTRTAFALVRVALSLFVFPAVTTAATVAALGHRANEWFAYPVAVAVTALSLFVGLNVTIWLAYSFR